MSPHAVIAVISGYIPAEAGVDFAGCADLVIRKPVELAVFNKVLDSAATISKTMAELSGMDEGPGSDSAQPT